MCFAHCGRCVGSGTHSLTTHSLTHSLTPSLAHSTHSFSFCDDTRSPERLTGVFRHSLSLETTFLRQTRVRVIRRPSLLRLSSTREALSYWDSLAPRLRDALSTTRQPVGEPRINNRSVARCSSFFVFLFFRFASLLVCFLLAFLLSFCVEHHSRIALNSIHSRAIVLIVEESPPSLRPSPPLVQRALARSSTS